MKSSVSSGNELKIEVIMTEFEKRKHADDKYSMRKFAEELNVNSGTLSKYLSGKRIFTEESFQQIISKIRLDDEVLNQYEQGIKELEILKEKFAKIKRHWYYYAIIELPYLNDFQYDIQWMANKIGLDFDTTKKAVDLLLDLGALVEINGTIENKLGSVTFVEEPNMDIEDGRVHQTELLENAIHSINNFEGHIKDHTSMTMAVDTALMDVIKEKIQVFEKEILDLIEENSNTMNEVYVLQINFNPAFSGKKKN